MKSLAVAAFSAQSKVSKIMFEASYSALDSTWATGVVPSCGTGCFRCSHLEDAFSEDETNGYGVTKMRS